MDASGKKPSQIQSFFDANANLVKDARMVDHADKELLAAVMTIKDLTEFLHDPNLNIVRDIEEEFIIDSLVVDIKKAINGVRSYKGIKRTGILETREDVYAVYGILYDAQIAAHGEQFGALKDALISCAKLLDSIYDQLQHWESLANEVRLNAAKQKPKDQNNISDLPPGNRPPTNQDPKQDSPPSV